MKRTFISLGLILTFLIAILATDLFFMSHYADGMLSRIDSLETAESYEIKNLKMDDLLAFYEANDFLAHRFVMTDRMDEIDVLIYRLAAFLEAEEDYEVSATIAELKARIHSLYSTWLYHWYHPREFGIE